MWAKKWVREDMPMESPTHSAKEKFPNGFEIFPKDIYQTILVKHAQIFVGG